MHLLSMYTPAEDADGVHMAALFQNLGRGCGQRRHDAFKVVIGVGDRLGEPYDFLAVNGLAVQHGGHLAVRAAGVEADAPAVQVAADGFGALHCLGLFVVGQALDDELRLVHLLHKALVKGAGAALAVRGADGRGHVVVAADAHLEAAPAPQKELDQTVHIIRVGLLHFRRTVDLGLVGTDLAARAFHGDAQGLRRALLVIFEEQAQGHKALVQLRHVFDGDVHIQEIHARTLLFC